MYAANLATNLVNAKNFNNGEWQSEKKVLEVDTRKVDTCEAQRLGLLSPLVRRGIKKHFADFGLEPEFVSHNTMCDLSGGQKVKIVLGTATWHCPSLEYMSPPTRSAACT